MGRPALSASDSNRDARRLCRRVSLRDPYQAIVMAGISARRTRGARSAMLLHTGTLPHVRGRHPSTRRRRPDQPVGRTSSAEVKQRCSRFLSSPRGRHRLGRCDVGASACSRSLGRCTARPISRGAAQHFASARLLTVRRDRVVVSLARTASGKLQRARSARAKRRRTVRSTIGRSRIQMRSWHGVRFHGPARAADCRGSPPSRTNSPPVS